MKLGYGQVLLALWVFHSPAIAQESNPLSAIDWLSESIEVAKSLGVPVPGSNGNPGPVAGEEPIVTTALTPKVTVTSLDSPSPDGVGLLNASATGLPADLWQYSSVNSLSALVGAQPVETLPALQELLTTLLLAEALPPVGSGPEGQFFLARVDKLLDLGALDPALELLEEAGPDTPTLFRRWFDVALLTGQEDRACATLRAKPEIAPTLPARIFCTARGGDWSAAALILHTARALGDVTDEEDALMSRFLDPDLFEDEPRLGPPSRPSPLVFRMREAIGEDLATASLPRAFARADLRSTVGWKAQIEAAERLARSGAVSGGELLNFYSARRPAASGGVWDRARAVQKLDQAIVGTDNEAVADALPGYWHAMRDAGTQSALAKIMDARLSVFEFEGDAAETAFKIGLLSADYETRANTYEGSGFELLVAIAKGDVSEISRPIDPISAAIYNAFDGASVPEVLQLQLEEGRLGEAILRARALFAAGVLGETQDITDALALLRAVGMEDIARRAALELLVLEAK